MVEVFRPDYDRIRDVSLLPKQIEALQKELAKVEAAEKEYGTSGKCKTDRKATLEYIKGRGALKGALVAQLEKEVCVCVRAARPPLMTGPRPPPPCARRRRGGGFALCVRFLFRVRRRAVMRRRNPRAAAHRLCRRTHTHTRSRTRARARE